MLGKAVNFLRTRKWLLSVVATFFAIAAILALSHNVSAIDPPLPPTTPGTSEVIEVDPGRPNETDAAETQPFDEQQVTETCQSQTGGMGWMICPGASWIADGVDKIYSAITQFLELKPIISDPNTPIYMVWSYVRDVANIIFVIVFLIAILSQISGVGFSNYNLKKMLPKLIIGAVLVNLSFVICAIAVDLSNVLGYGITSTFQGIQSELIMRGGIDMASAVNPGEYIVAALAGVGVGGAAVFAAGGLGALLWVLLPLVLSFLVAVLAAFLTLVARQALVIILVMIAPLAMVAFILPNTEQWFSKWKTLGMKLLILFPMLSLLIGAAKLAGWAIVASSDSAWTSLLGFAVQIVPLFVAPSLFKMSGTILNKVNDLARKPFGGAQDTLKGWSQTGRDFNRLNNQRRNPFNKMYANQQAKKAAMEKTLEDMGKVYTNQKAIKAIQRAKKHPNSTRSARRAFDAIYQDNLVTSTSNQAKTDAGLYFLSAAAGAGIVKAVSGIGSKKYPHAHMIQEALIKDSKTYKKASIGAVTEIHDEHFRPTESRDLQGLLDFNRGFQRDPSTGKIIMTVGKDGAQVPKEYRQFTYERFNGADAHGNPVWKPIYTAHRDSEHLWDREALLKAYVPVIADAGGIMGLRDVMVAHSQKPADVAFRGKMSKWMKDEGTIQDIPFVTPVFRDTFAAGDIKTVGDFDRTVVRDEIARMKPNNFSTMDSSCIDYFSDLLMSDKYDADMKAADTSLNDALLREEKEKAKQTILKLQLEATSNPGMRVNMDQATTEKLLDLVQRIDPDYGKRKGKK